MGIEPTAQAWEAWVLPLYDARYALESSRVPLEQANPDEFRPIAARFETSTAYLPMPERKG
jgi:hypothetical protein